MSAASPETSGIATPPSSEDTRIDRVVRLTLATSLAVGLVLLLIAIVLTLAGRGALSSGLAWPAEAARRASRSDAQGFYVLGLLVIIMTPFVRVVGSAIAFVIERDWLYVAITLTVLAVMVLTVWIGVS